METSILTSAVVALLTGGIGGALVSYFLPRYVPPRRYLELMEIQEIAPGPTMDGNLYFRVDFIVHYEGTQVELFPIAEWEPKKSSDRRTLLKHKGKQHQQPRSRIYGQPLSGNWSICTLTPSKGREGLWLYPGETVKLSVHLVFPALLLVRQWKNRDVAGRIWLKYGQDKFLKFDHTVTP